MKNSIKINFQDKEIGFFFGLSFLGYFYDKFDLDVSQVSHNLQNKPFSFIPLLMFESYIHNCERNELNSEYNNFTFADLLDENGGVTDDNGAAAIFLKAFMESIISRLPKVEEEIEEPKKK